MFVHAPTPAREASAHDGTSDSISVLATQGERRDLRRPVRGRPGDRILRPGGGDDIHPDDLPLYPYFDADSEPVAWAREHAAEFLPME